MAPTNGEKKKKATKPGWADSLAKELLWTDLCSGEVPLHPEYMPAEEVYLLRPEFEFWPFDQFKDRLADLRVAFIAKDSRSSRAAAALKRARELHPKPTLNHRGETQWEGSDAQRLLKEDIENGAHLEMKPIDLWQSRPEYILDCPILKVFRDHIY